VNAAAAAKLLPKDAAVRKLAGDLRFVEGPVWVEAQGGYLVFSVIPANELKRWDAAGGLRTFRTPSGNANGNTVDREGRLLHAEHSGRIARTERDGTVTTVVDRVDGARLSSPNDAVVKSDGSIWFTDPSYGLAGRKQETPDGIRCDELGNVWSSAGDGVQVFSPSGALLARVLLPESAANLAWGRPQGARCS